MNASSAFDLRIRVLEAHGLNTMSDKKSLPDPFVVAKFKGMKYLMNKVQTSVFPNTVSPMWNQDLTLAPRNTADVLLIKVYDKDALKNNLLGMVEIPLERVFQQGVQDNWFQLMKRKAGWKTMVGGHPTWFSVPGTIHLQLWFGMANQFTGLAPIQPSPMANMMNMPSTGMGMTGTGMTGTMNPMTSTGTIPVTTGTMNPMTSTSGMTPSMTSTGTAPMTSTGMNPPMPGMVAKPILEPHVTKDFASGFNPITAPQFQWYQTSTTTTATTSTTPLTTGM